MTAVATSPPFEIVLRFMSCTRRFFFSRMFTPLVTVYNKQLAKLQMRGDTYVLQGVAFGEQEVLRVLQDCG